MARVRAPRGRAGAELTRFRILVQQHERPQASRREVRARRARRSPDLALVKLEAHGTQAAHLRPSHDEPASLRRRRAARARRTNPSRLTWEELVTNRTATPAARSFSSAEGAPAIARSPTWSVPLMSISAAFARSIAELQS